MKPENSSAPQGGSVLELLELYAEVTGGTVTNLAPDLYEFTPALGRGPFSQDSEAPTPPGGRTDRIATSLVGLDADPEAEMAMVGSGFFRRLVNAIRVAGHRLDAGYCPPTPTASETEPVAVTANQARITQSHPQQTWVPVGRLAARVTLRSGSELEERMVETDWCDLTTGAPVSFEPGVPRGAEPGRDGGTISHADALPPAELMATLVDLVERSMSDEVDELTAKTERALGHELGRLDRFYSTLRKESARAPNPAPSAADTLDSEHALRRSEQLDRHRVAAMVRPFQLETLFVLAQRSTLTLAAEDGTLSANVSASRFLVDDAVWELACPGCAAPSPDRLSICSDGHVSCEACTHGCSTCGGATCEDHFTRCHIDGAPTCSRHSVTCLVCARVHCSGHEARCKTGHHEACESCVEFCQACGTPVCTLHSEMSAPDAPLGSRRLCKACVRHCEGSTEEVVGVDEVVGCTTCHRVICSRHQVACAVDEAVHCSKHLRRTDDSRRLVCETHRSRCAREQNAVYASDEVRICVTCDAVVCGQHGAECAADGQWHCDAHIEPLARPRGEHACDAHREYCHVDGLAFLEGVAQRCPICEKPACPDHREVCEYCSRDICQGEMEGGRCLTCRRLVDDPAPDDELIAASLDVRSDKLGSPTAWSVARDATHRVASIRLSGWWRTLVITVPHGGGRPDTAVLHGWFRKRVLRGG